MFHLSIEYKSSNRPTSNRLEHPLLEVLESVYESGSIGKGAELTPQAIEFLDAVSKIQVDLAPQFAHIKNCLQQCVTVLQATSAPHHT